MSKKEGGRQRSREKNISHSILNKDSTQHSKIDI